MSLDSLIVTVVTIGLGLASAVIAYLAWQRPRPPLTGLSPSTLTPSGDVRSRYLQFIQAHLEYLDFRGVVRLDRLDVKFKLEDVAISPRLRLVQALVATTITTGQRENDTHELARALGYLIVGRDESSSTRSLEDIITPSAVTVILGDPGAGKSTALKLLALKTASAGLAGQSDLLPILVPLTAYADAVGIASAGGHVPSVSSFLVDHLQRVQNAESVGDLVENALQKGRTIILFDGLDELSAAAERSFVISRVEDFIRWQRPAGNCFIITSRIVGYSDHPLNVDDSSHLLLSDFDDNEVGEFVDRWSLVAERVARSPDDSQGPIIARQAAAALKRSIFENAGVRRLACNPLLLTILVFIHRQGMELPRRRAELYDLYVRTLLNSWARARNLDRRPIDPLDETEVTKVIAPMAYWVHSTQPSGHCQLPDFVNRLASIYVDWKGLDEEEALERASRLVDSLMRSSGLLVERGENRVSFAHLTFEEYLTARYIVMQGQIDKQRSVKLLAEHIGEAAWREITNLVIGYLGIVAKEEQSAGLVLNGLLADSTGVAPDERLLWAAEAAADCGAEGLPLESWNKLRSDVRRAASSLPSRESRWRAGAVLSLLGDPLLEKYEEIPEMIDVPEGDMLMGAPKEFIQSRLDEINRADLSSQNEWVRAYWQLTVSSEGPERVTHVTKLRVGRFPITNLQYARFIAATDRYVPTSVSARSMPFGWDESLRLPPSGRENQPVVLVSWDDAQAFCSWLSAKTGRRFRLPREEEWEYCAKGNTRYLYPWGVDWDAGKANTMEGDAEDLVAVGLYPEGASPFGVEECVGQVWEWTTSNWGADWQHPVRAGSEQTSESRWKVVRGGSWDDLRAFANCSARGTNLIDFRSHYIGFRIVEDVRTS